MPNQYTPEPRSRRYKIPNELIITVYFYFTGHPKFRIFSYEFYVFFNAKIDGANENLRRSLVKKLQPIEV